MYPKFNSDAVFEKYSIQEFDYFSDVGFFSGHDTGSFYRETKPQMKFSRILCIVLEL